MAIALEDKPNVDAPSALYPNGNIRDNPGDGSGTPVNKLVYADLHQFFARLIAESGIRYNGQPENAYDGFQYIDALRKLITSINIPYELNGVTFQNSASAGANFGIKKTFGGNIKITGIVNGPPAAYANQAIYLTLPIGFRPSYNKIIPVSVTMDTASDFVANAHINTDGTIFFYTDHVGSTSYQSYIHFDGLEFEL